MSHYLVEKAIFMADAKRTLALLSGPSYFGPTMGLNICLKVLTKKGCK